MALVCLPDDLLREILVRLEELAVLFRCAMACKRLCLLIADPTFFRQRCPNQEAGCQPSFSFVGFIAKDKRPARRDGVNGLVIPAPRSGLGPGCRDLGSFMTTTYAGHLDGAVPLASRGGLLLLRLADLDRTVVHMAVCNLLAGTCHLLPPLKLRSAYDDYEWCAYAVLTGVDCRHTSDERRRSNSMFFKVAVIGSDENMTRYSLYTFASREVSWRTRVNCLSIGERTHGSFSDVMVRHGMAHWLSSGPGRFYDLITFNIQSGHISCKEIHVLPLDYNRTGRPCLTLDIDETLSLLWMHCPRPELEILVQQREQQNVGGNSEWLRTGMVELNQPEDKKTQPRWLCILGEKYGTILVKDGGQNVYTVEVKTGTIEEVKEWPRRCDIIPWEPIPFEMDWSAFFISRLGTRSRKGGSKSMDHHGKASKEVV